MVETMQTSKKDGHFNESIVNEEILEDMKKNRIDHMKYLPDMEQLEESDVMDQVISAMKAYDYDKYTEADVRRALAHDNRTPEDFQALLSPAALPLLEEIAQQHRLKQESILETVCICSRQFILQTTVKITVFTVDSTVIIRFAVHSLMKKRLKKKWLLLPRPDFRKY